MYVYENIHVVRKWSLSPRFSLSLVLEAAGERSVARSARWLLLLLVGGGIFMERSPPSVLLGRSLFLSATSQDGRAPRCLIHVLPPRAPWCCYGNIQCQPAWHGRRESQESSKHGRQMRGDRACTDDKSAPGGEEAENKNSEEEDEEDFQKSRAGSQGSTTMAFSPTPWNVTCAGANAFYPPPAPNEF